MTDQTDIAHGLEDVVVAATRLSSVDGEHGELVIADEQVGDLHDKFTYEQLAARLLTRASNDGDESDPVVTPPDALANAIGQARLHTHELLNDSPQIADHIASIDAPMAALRAGVALLPNQNDSPEDADHTDAATVIGAIPVINAWWWHRRHDDTPPAPDPQAGHVRDYLRLLTGGANEAEVDALERYLMAVSDHGMNASTFTARVITSTGSDLISALTGAIGALKGPLHGGAPGPVLDMLDAIQSADSAESWLTDRLDAGERIMGMGHRVYQVRDPRATVFENAVDTLRESVNDDNQNDATQRRLQLARHVEQTAEQLLAERYPDRSLRANVEFYTAVLLEAVGIPRELFTNTFATGRAAGWAAHATEQRRTGRLIRPRSLYKI